MYQTKIEETVDHAINLIIHKIEEDYGIEIEDTDKELYCSVGKGAIENWYREQTQDERDGDRSKFKEKWDID